MILDSESKQRSSSSSTDSTFPLLVHPRRRRDQCRQDYLMSVAEANGLRGINELTKTLHAHYAVLVTVSDDTLDDGLSGRGLLPPLPTMRWRASPYELNRLGLGGRAWICPGCLEDGRPSPTQFNSSFGLHCSVHNLVLVNKCPRCKEQICYRRIERNSCDCRGDLRTSPRVPTPDWIDKLHRLFAPWRLGEANISQDQVELEFDIARFLRTLLTDNPRKKWQLAYPHFSVADLPLLASLVQDWPRTFEKLAYKNARSWRHNRAKHLYAPWLPLLPELDAVMGKLRHEFE